MGFRIGLVQISWFSIQIAHPHDAATHTIRHGNNHTKPWYVPSHGNAHTRWQILLLAGPGVVVGTFATAGLCYAMLPYGWSFSLCVTVWA